MKPPGAVRLLGVSRCSLRKIFGPKINYMLLCVSCCHCAARIFSIHLHNVEGGEMIASFIDILICLPIM